MIQFLRKLLGFAVHLPAPTANDIPDKKDSKRVTSPLDSKPLAENKKAVTKKIVVAKKEKVISDKPLPVRRGRPKKS